MPTEVKELERYTLHANALLESDVIQMGDMSRGEIAVVTTADEERASLRVYDGDIVMKVWNYWVSIGRSHTSAWSDLQPGQGLRVRRLRSTSALTLIIK